MQFSEWSLLLLLMKLANYTAIAALAGTLLIRFISHFHLNGNQHTAFLYFLKHWQIKCLMVGLIAAVLQTPIEAGAIAESGFMGMLDRPMLEIVWYSVIGEQARLRIVSFLVALMVASLWNVKAENNNAEKFNFALMLIIAALIAYSFSITGHSANENGLVKSILTFHLAALACWIGALWPLLKSFTLLIKTDVEKIMHHFGQMAIIIVVVLLVSGLALLQQYLHSFSALFTSTYGQLILLKLLLVSAMLLLGAWHKLFLVPNINRQRYFETLKGSIAVEMVIALFVLITTSVFTTLVGPPI